MNPWIVVVVGALLAGLIAFGVVVVADVLWRRRKARHRQEGLPKAGSTEQSGQRVAA